MVQRYGHINGVGPKIRRVYTKKAHPGGNWTIGRCNWVELTNCCSSRRSSWLYRICFQACRSLAAYNFHRSGARYIQILQRNSYSYRCFIGCLFIFQEARNTLPPGRTHHREYREGTYALHWQCSSLKSKFAEQIGNDYYRQMVGIPQGSVLSALLCSFFYGDLERQRLPFARDPSNVKCFHCSKWIYADILQELLRLIDDYLFITTSLSQAKHFLDVMKKGMKLWFISCLL